MLVFTVPGLGRVTSSPFAGKVAPSEEVVAFEYRANLEERIHRAVIQAAREANARSEIFDGITFEREVIAVNEL
jgi:hypothetical protein